MEKSIIEKTGLDVLWKYIFQYGILMGTCRAVAFLTFLGHFVHDCLLHPDFTFGKMRISLAVFLLNKSDGFPRTCQMDRYDAAFIQSPAGLDRGFGV